MTSLGDLREQDLRRQLQRGAGRGAGTNDRGEYKGRRIDFAGGRAFDRFGGSRPVGAGRGDRGDFPQGQQQQGGWGGSSQGNWYNQQGIGTNIAKTEVLAKISGPILSGRKAKRTRDLLALLRA